MIEESAVVIRCEGDFAWVEATRQSACGQCSASAACGTGVLDKLWGHKAARMKALNRAQARAGERVLIGLQETALVRGSLILYLLPIVSLLLFAIFGKAMASQWQLPGEAVSILFGIAGFLLAGMLVRLFSRRIQTDPAYQPVILKRLAP